MADIKEKIRKLLSLASSPNENEARSALLMAQKLMAKHKLSEGDFEDKERKLVHTVCANVKWATDSGEIWVANLARVLCDNYVCVSSWLTAKGRRTHTLQISGFEDDVQVCGAMVEYAVGFVRNSIRILQRKHLGLDPRAIAKSYADGFISGLEMAFEEQRDDHSEWGLVLIKPQEVQDYEKSLGDKTVKIPSADFDPLAYISGQVDGKNFNKNKSLEGAVQ